MAVRFVYLFLCYAYLHADLICLFFLCFSFCFHCPIVPSIINAPKWTVILFTYLEVTSMYINSLVFWEDHIKALGFRNVLLSVVLTAAKQETLFNWCQEITLYSPYVLLCWESWQSSHGMAMQLFNKQNFDEDKRLPSISNFCFIRKCRCKLPQGPYNQSHLSRSCNDNNIDHTRFLVGS